MSKRTYPCQVFTLTANYSIRKLTLARPYSETSDAWGAYTPSGKFYRREVLFDTKAKAIKAGRAKIKRIQKRLDLAAEALKKHTAALDKAESIAPAPNGAAANPASVLREKDGGSDA